jgi:hypothetical protein
MPNLKEKWESIHSKFDTCTCECLTNYRSDAKCKDSIEALMADIWNLKDWLLNDATSGVSKSEMNTFLISSDAFHLGACADLETQNKHFKVTNEHRNRTILSLEGNHKHESGYPVVFSVTRYYENAPSSADRWEDAFELARRAIDEWKGFLSARLLL